ncbi:MULTISPECIES: cellulose binding domain-containing protein [Actinosynnema]|uniref:pectate lyase family protein n=1 Tax=Actinosynnema TaxID=40566 RepID=UPI0027E33528|nr:cellulose binding domain-containing protein [Actinosynnema pretiosum]MCP2097064.1 Pectate lyase [Actinosynnema pretiosum]
MTPESPAPRPRAAAAAAAALLLGAALLLVTRTAPTAEAAACDDRLTGWATVAGSGANGTTGGGGAAPQTVTTLADLQKYGGDSTPRVLVVSGTITTGSYAVDIASNKTLIGADRNATIRGGINIRSGSSNIIVRNLNFHGFWPNPGPDDTIAARGAHHLWFDHLNVWNAGDGLMDLTQGSDFITVSWVKFWYTDASHGHRLASLVSSGADNDATDVGKLNATFHHNWFAELVDQRMPRVLYGKGHVYNNYYTATGNGYAVGVGALASVLVENNYFKKTNNPHQFMYVRPSHITARGNTYDGTTGKRDTGAGGEGGGVTPFTSPPYAYAPDAASAVPDLVSRCAGPVLSGGTTPTSTTTTTRTTTTGVTTTTKPPTGACSAAHRTTNTWQGGFQGEVTVTAGSAGTAGWTARWSLGSGQAITQLWNGLHSTSGTTVTVRNADYNGTLAPGASTTFGYTATGSASAPSVTCASP